MPTIDCPECGLPRAASEASKPCPVCSVGVREMPRPRRALADDGRAGLPADGSELSATASHTPHGHRPEIFAGVLGVVIGAVAVLAIQSLLPRETKPADREVAPITSPNVAANVAPVNELPPPEPAKKPEVELPAPLERVEVAPPPVLVDERPEVMIEFNRPDGAYAFNSTMISKGQKAVLRGQLKTLSFYGLADVSIDASALKVEHVNIGGRLDNATLKIASPQCYVICSPMITNRSRVTFDVPEGKVLFNYPQSGVESGSQIDVRTRLLEIRGSVAGEGTRVRVTLDNGGELRLNALRGPAVVEYRKSNPDDVAPRIEIPAGGVDPKAILRRIE